MSNSLIEVIGYSIDNLIRLFASISDTPEEEIEGKLHSTYFKEYFDALQTKTIVVERGYVDHDFLEDFAKYYVKCFSRYERFCTRLHFFSLDFSAENISSLYLGKDGPITFSDLEESYLGFIVVKPIPKTFVGRTCLKCYPPDNGRRYYPATRSCDAHLFGLTLRVDSLAFQEQDTVVAACATSALWSVFQATGKLFQHSIPSPVEITEAAQVAYDVNTRAFPNDGLTLAQMAQSIRSVSLEPRLVNVANEEHILKGNIYAYIKGQIPLILTLRLEDQGVCSHDVMGYHAVAATGFSLGPSNPTPLATTGLLLQATRIDKIYGHDDQVGPFSRMVFQSGELSTSWRSPGSGKIGDVIAVPLELLLPEHNKIRIPFDVVHDAVVPFDQLIEGLRSKGFLHLVNRLEWDIYLLVGSDLKAELLRDQTVSADLRREFLFEPMPRFIWRATATCGNDKVLDLLFDATDVPQGKFFLHAIEYDSFLSIMLRTVCKAGGLISAFKRDRAGRILEWFQDQPLP